MKTPRPVAQWRPSTPAVRADSFDELAESPAIAIHFWGSWNAYDPTMDRSIQAIAGQFTGRMLFFSCEVDRPENHELCRRFGVTNIPSLGILVPGRPRKLLTGCRDADNLASEIQAACA